MANMKWTDTDYPPGWEIDVCKNLDKKLLDYYLELAVFGAA